jgi:hypothetical protein
MRPSLDHEEHPPAVREPRTVCFGPGTEVEDLAVVSALSVHEPDLQARRIQVVPVVEDQIPWGVEPGCVVVAPLRTCQYLALAGLEIVAVDPGLLYLLPAPGVEVRPVDEPPPVSVHLAAPNVVLRRFFDERLHHPRLREPYPEETHSFVPVPVLADHDRAAIRRPRDDQRVVRGLCQPDGG